MKCMKPRGIDTRKCESGPCTIGKAAGTEDGSGGITLDDPPLFSGARILEDPGFGYDVILVRFLCLVKILILFGEILHTKMQLSLII